MKSVLDDALERLRHTGPEAADGAPNHGPMAAEALVALGYDDDVPQWVDTYRRQLGPMPETLLPVTMQAWHDALGLHRRDREESLPRRRGSRRARHASANERTSQHARSVQPQIHHRNPPSGYGLSAQALPS